MSPAPPAGRSLFDKLWSAHVVGSEGEQDLLFIDLHLVQEVSSFRAFEQLREWGLKVRRPDLTLAMTDHIVPTIRRPGDRPSVAAETYLASMKRNGAEHGLEVLCEGHPLQGIVHVVGPELGATLPGMSLVCGDSHTSTHGALGALAFGVGTTQVAHVLATQTLLVTRPKVLQVKVDGSLPPAGAAKDLALVMTRQFGNLKGLGMAIEYAGSAIEQLSVEARMTLCNMGIELGARSALVAPDDATFAYVENRPYAPRGAAFERALEAWRALPSDPDASYDEQLRIDGATAVPHVTWGTTPAQAAPIAGTVPDPDAMSSEQERSRAARALEYMGLQPGTALCDVPIDAAFIGSCTNSRIEDLRSAAAVLRGRHVVENLTAVVSPGSTSVKRQAEAEGLDRIFKDAGFEWRASGCSFCVAANGDRFAPGARSASTTNRNFENRQGPGVRTHLMSPASVAASAVAGRISSIEQLDPALVGEC